MSRWPAAGPSEYWLLPSSPASKVMLVHWRGHYTHRAWQNLCVFSGCRRDCLVTQWYCLWPFGKVAQSTEEGLVTFTWGFICPGDIGPIPSGIHPLAQVSFSLVLIWYIDRTVKFLSTSRCIIHLCVFLTPAWAAYCESWCWWMIWYIKLPSITSLRLSAKLHHYRIFR